MNLSKQQQKIEAQAEKMEEQREAQVRGEIKFQQASEDPETEIREDEQNLFHVELKMINFIQATQTTEEDINVATFDQETWKRIKDSATIQGYHRQRVLHDPTKAKKAEKKAEPKDEAKKADTGMEELRAEYEQVTGNKAGNRKAETLQKEIDEAKAAE